MAPSLMVILLRASTMRMHVQLTVMQARRRIHVLMSKLQSF